MKIREEYKIREMAGEHVIVMPGGGGAADMTRIVSLNPSSLYLWEALRGRDLRPKMQRTCSPNVMRSSRNRLAGCRAVGRPARGVRNCGMMNVKKGISLLLMTVYLLATAGAAVVSLTCRCVEQRVHVEHGMSFGMPARHARRRGRAFVLRLRTPFDRHRTLSLFVRRERRTPYPLHGHRPASRHHCGVSVSRTGSRSAGKERRKAFTFRTGGLDSSRRLPGPSRIGLKLLRDPCCAHRSAISFNDNGNFP